ncbi:MAG: DNA polymerase III subunit chi [Simkaniaceae bacterium]
MRVVFISVKNNQEKANQIIKLVKKNLLNKENILILAKNKQSAEFLDDMLWSYDEVSFLPHTLSSVPCQDRVVITTEIKNLNEAQTLINLTDKPIMNFSFQTLYLFDDHTSPQREAVSKKIYQEYKSSGYSIALLS